MIIRYQLGNTALPVIFIISSLSLYLFMSNSLFLCLSISLSLSLSFSLSLPLLFPEKKFPALDPSLVTSHLYSRLPHFPHIQKRSHFVEPMEIQVQVKSSFVDKVEATLLYCIPNSRCLFGLISCILCFKYSGSHLM